MLPGVTRNALRHVYTGVLICLLASVLTVRPLTAEDRLIDQSVSEMSHSVWTGRDGVPRVILCMAQTPNGILWIGSTRGLYTFDGLNFTPFRPAEDSPPLPDGTIFSIFVARNSDVWLFYYREPPVRIRNNRVVVFGRADDTTIGYMGSPQEDGHGDIWAIFKNQQLFKMAKDGLWHRHVAPSGTLSTLFVDSRDTVWLVANDRLYRMSSAESNFSPTQLLVYGRVDNPAVHGEISMAESPSHDIWIAAASPGAPNPALHPLQHVDQAGKLLTQPKVKFTYGGLLTAPDGSLWLDTQAALIHIHADQLQENARTQKARQQDRAPLQVAGDGALFRAFLRGNDGSIWLGGLGGLERFASATLIQATPGVDVGFQRSCLGAGGVLWFTDRLERLFRKQAGSPPQATRFNGVHALSCSKLGEIVITRQGVTTIMPHQIKRLPSLPGAAWSSNRAKPEGAVFAADGSVLAAGTVDAKGPILWRFQGKQWRSIPLGEGIAKVTALHVRSDGTVLVGIGSKPPFILTGDRAVATSLGSTDLGTITGFAETSYGVFACGGSGVAILRGNTFAPVLFAQPELVNRTSGLAEASDGSLWLNANRGIVFVPPDSISRYLQKSTAKVDSISIHEGSFIGPAIFDDFVSTVQRDSAGKLVFGSLDGVLIVDPQRFRMPQPPLLSITRIAGNDVALRPDRVFPQDVSRLTFTYVGVQYDRPRDVSYRYRLVGLDQGWQDVEASTQAMYTNVRPGSYQFEVQARNAFGLWSSVVSSETFRIAPHYYQMLWFKALLGCLLVCAMALLFRLRMKYIAAAIQSKANERADERIVIARDLHDTLLQGVQGLLLAFHAAADRVADGHESKPSLERALVTADKLILEGRRTVKRLRLGVVPEGQVVPSLQSLAREISDLEKISFAVTSEREQWPLSKSVADQVVLIATEAVRNAVRHAQPTEIRIDLRSSRGQFVLSCSDNGHGFSVDPAGIYIDDTDDPGHWGVRGMHERADRIGGMLEITSVATGGTVVRLTVPGRRAYR